MSVITISGQLGSDRDLIAARVSQALGWRLLGASDLQAAASAQGLPANLLDEIAAEGQQTLMQQLLGALQVLPHLPGQWSLPTNPVVGSTEDYVSRLDAIVHALTNEGHCVLRITGGAMLLREHPDTLHVHIIAPIRARVERLMEREHLERDAAVERIRLGEEQAERFARRYQQLDWQNPQLYDLIINRRYYSIEGAARLIQISVTSEQSTQ